MLQGKSVMKETSLFSKKNTSYKIVQPSFESIVFSKNSFMIPLAEQVRPISLENIIGQDLVVGNKSALKKLIETFRFTSFILWGPPGCGKVNAKLFLHFTYKNFLKYYRNLKLQNFRRNYEIIKQTTLARVIAHQCTLNNSQWRFIQLSATSSGTAKVKQCIEVARNDKKMFKKRTVLFIDEIHRFNKTQQVLSSCS